MPKAPSKNTQKTRARTPSPSKPTSPPKAKASAPDRATGPVPEFVATGQLAALLDYSTRWITKLVQEGVLTKEGYGTFNLKASINSIIAYNRQLDEKKSEESAGDRLKDTRRLEVERNMAREDRKIISLDESLEALESLVGLFVESLDSIPGQITSDQVDRAKLTVVLDRIRGDLSTRLGKESLALRTGERSS